MRKHTSTTGPTGPRRIRSLLAFRHDHPLARLVSALAAFAIAALLVTGTGAAYAGDSGDPSGDPTAAASADPSSDPSADPSGAATPSSDPTSDPGSGAGTDATGGQPSADTPATDAPAGPSRPQAPTSTTVKSAAIVPAADPCLSTPVIGGFEVDGDECAVTDLDWDTVDTASPEFAVTNDHFVDSGDTTGYQGSSKSLTDPLTWSKGPAPNDKSDIDRVRVYSQKSGPDDHLFSDFAIDRHPDDGGAGGTGTVTYDVEYNQLTDQPSNDKTLSVPRRSPGDLWFVFDQHGNISLDYVAGYKYFATDQGGCKAVAGGGYWCALPAAPTFGGATSADGSFAEGTLDISDAFDQGVCFTFGVVNVRTRTSNTDTTAFKDYIAPLDAVTSNCGSLQVQKLDADSGSGVAGAVFAITGDPRPNGDPNDTYCLFDGVQADMPAKPAVCDIYEADGAADGAISIPKVIAGTYTIAEVVPPPGYLLNPEPDPGNSQDVTVVDGDPALVEFRNHAQWAPLDISKTAQGSFDATYLWGINKQIAPSAAGPWSDGTTPGAPLTKTVDAGGNTSLYYRVVVTEKGIDKTNYTVTGTITVSNPNDRAVTATISESLPNCTIDGQASPITRDVPADGETSGTSYAYSCDLGDNLANPPTQNTASVVWDRSDYPQSVDDIGAPGDYDPVVTDPAPVSWGIASQTDRTVVVTDDHFTFDPAWVITWGDEEDGTYESAVYSIDTHAATGTCSAVITNTASVAGQVLEVLLARSAVVAALASDSESGRVCVNPPPAAPVVEVSPPQHHPSVLPNTGGPDRWVLAGGVALLLAGGALVAGDRRRKRRS